MVIVPAPTIVTALFVIVATAVLLDANVNNPVLLEVGIVSAKFASPNVLLIAAMLPIVGVAFATVKVVDTEPAL